MTEIDTSREAVDTIAAASKNIARILGKAAKGKAGIAAICASADVASDTLLALLSRAERAESALAAASCARGQHDSGTQFCAIAVDAVRQRDDALAEVERLREAARRLAPYIIWQLSDESPGYHSTLPSAFSAFKETFNGNASTSAAFADGTIMTEKPNG